MNISGLSIKWFTIFAGYVALMTISVVGFFFPAEASQSLGLYVIHGDELWAQGVYVGLGCFALIPALTYFGIDTTRSFHLASLIATALGLLLLWHIGGLAELLAFIAFLYSVYRVFQSFFVLSK